MKETCKRRLRSRSKCESSSSVAENNYLMSKETDTSGSKSEDIRNFLTNPHNSKEAIFKSSQDLIARNSQDIERSPFISPSSVKSRLNSSIKKAKRTKLTTIAPAVVGSAIKKGSVASLITQVERRLKGDIYRTSTPVKTNKRKRASKHQISEKFDETSSEDEEEGFHTPLVQSTLNLSEINTMEERRQLDQAKNSLFNQCLAGLSATEQADNGEKMEVNDQANPETMSISTVMAMFQQLSGKMDVWNVGNAEALQQIKVGCTESIKKAVEEDINEYLSEQDLKVEKLSQDTGHLKYKN